MFKFDSAFRATRKLIFTPNLLNSLSSNFSTINFISPKINKSQTGIFYETFRTIKTSSISKSKNSKDLCSALNQEILEEVANDEVDTELENIKKRILKTFTIEDNAGNGLVKLVRKFKNEDITITFDCQDENDGSIDEDSFVDEEEKEGDSEEDEDEEAMTYSIGFTVSVKKGEKDLVLDCIADQALSIERVKLISAEGQDASTYDGPPFENLSDSLQEAFIEYLEARKIDGELCEFILSYSQYKEQKEYVHWLKKLAHFTEA